MIVLQAARSEGSWQVNAQRRLELYTGGGCIFITSRVLIQVCRNASCD